MLDDHSALSIGDYDESKVQARPREEEANREDERQSIRSMLEAREAKIVQSIEFRIKYPRKVPTKVPPGVEFDKAHEEKAQLPDTFTDEELLGISLAPLWKQWRKCGGLLKELEENELAKAEIDPDKAAGEEKVTQWTIYDSADLTDSLKMREDALYGIVGARSMYRLRHMRELVDRERSLFMNKKNFVQAFAQSESAERTPTKKKSRSPNTSVKPFKLSESPSMLKKIRVMDCKSLIQDMKQSFDGHLATLHRIRKDQLEKEVAREHATSGR